MKRVRRVSTTRTLYHIFYDMCSEFPFILIILFIIRTLFARGQHRCRTFTSPWFWWLLSWTILHEHPHWTSLPCGKHCSRRVHNPSQSDHSSISHTRVSDPGTTNQFQCSWSFPPLSYPWNHHGFRWRRAPSCQISPILHSFKLLPHEWRLNPSSIIGVL